MTWLFQGQENVFARSVLCDEAISKFMSFARLSGDCFGKNRLATTYRRFVKRPWNHHTFAEAISIIMEKIASPKNGSQ